MTIAGDGGKLRILHVFRSPVGGLFRHVVDLARGQIQRGHEVGIFCDLSTGGEPAADVLSALRPSLKLGLARVPMSRYPGRADVEGAITARRLARELSPHVMHGHGSKGGLYARLPAFVEGRTRPVRAYTPHGGSFHYHRGAAHALYMSAERLLALRTDVFLFESEYIADRFKAYVGATKKPVRIVYNGLAEAEFEPIVHGPDAHDLLYIGELRVAKGVDTLIEAMTLLRQRDGRRLSLLIVGAGADEQIFRSQVLAHGLLDSVTFAPPSPILQVLAKGAVMVVPSRAESLPYVVLEAAAAGEPIVATRVGGIPEIFGPHAGRLIQPDDPNGLARAIGAVLDLSDEDRKTQAFALRNIVRQRFSLPAMVDGVLDGYREALARRSRRSR